MKPSPPPNIPGNTEAERMDAAVRKMFSVSKDDLLREETKLKHGKRPKNKKTA